MRFFACLILAACGVGALAQPANAFGPTAQLLDRRLQELKGGLLVVVDGPKGAWKAKADALAADPDWIGSDLSLAYYGAKAGEVAALLEQKYQSGPRPQWVLFGDGGRVVASGGKPPEGPALAKLAADGGIRSKLQILRDFVRTHPDHLEARGALCQSLEFRAAQLTGIRLGEKTEPIRPADERFDMAKFQKERDAKAEAKEKKEQEDSAPKPAIELEPEQDQAIWGELADLLTRTFRSGDWLEMSSWELVPLDAAVHSPFMKAACRAAIPDVESALARNPGSWSLWQLWLGLARTDGGRPIRPLLDNLVPLPTLSPTAWPPFAVREAYVKDARKRKDWLGIKDLLLPQIEFTRLWEAAKGQTTFLLKTDGKVQEEPETGDYWRSTLEPLVEALLHLGETAQADGLVRDYWTKHPWAGLPGRAASLATRCGQPNFAVQWAALGAGR